MAANVGLSISNESVKIGEETMESVKYFCYLGSVYYNHRLKLQPIFIPYTTIGMCGCL